MAHPLQLARRATGHRQTPSLEPARAFELADAARLAGGHTPGLLRPVSEAQVAEAVRRYPTLLPVGARTSVTGGATPMGAVVISLEAMNALAFVGPDRVRVGAGVTSCQLNAWLAGHGAWFPPVPSYDLAQIGGAISTNAAGPSTFRYGSTRAWVEALTVVLANGDVLDLDRGACRVPAGELFEIAGPSGLRRGRAPTYRLPDVPKVSAGYHAAPVLDLIDLFIGAEGTLGILISAVVRVVKPAPQTRLLLMRCPDEASAFRLNRRLRAAALSGALPVSAIEYIDGRGLALATAFDPGPALALGLSPDEAALIVHIEGPFRLEAMDAARTADRLAIVDDPALADAIRAVRANVPLAVNARVAAAQAAFGPGLNKVAADMIVPFDHFEAFTAATRQAFDRRGLDLAVWGHSSDGNLHPNLIPRDAADVALGREAVLEVGGLAIALGGSPLAEHGVGRDPIKQRLLSLLYGEQGIAEMRAIRQGLDPEGKFAPGVLF
jgi:D-lactate dehydrogenase (cytochrome)